MDVNLSVSYIIILFEFEIYHLCAIFFIFSNDIIFHLDINKNARTKMTSTLSFDSRAISESAAADFLETVQWLLQNPVNIVIGASKKAKRYA